MMKLATETQCPEFGVTDFSSGTEDTESEEDFEVPFDEAHVDRRRIEYLERELLVMHKILSELINDEALNDKNITITAPAAYFDLISARESPPPPPN